MSTTLEPPVIAKNLADLRHEAGLTTRQVATPMNLTHPRIVQIESNGTKDIDQLRALATIYGVTFDVLQAANDATRNR